MSVFNNPMSNGVCEDKFQSQVILRFFKNTYIFKKGEILRILKLLDKKGASILLG